MATATPQTKESVMEAKASARHVRVSPQKARRVVDLIRGKAAADAVTTLTFAPQAASLVHSARVPSYTGSRTHVPGP